MTKHATKDVEGRPPAPIRMVEKHENNIHRLALHSLGVVREALEQRWQQRVQPMAHFSEHQPRID